MNLWVVVFALAALAAVSGAVANRARTRRQTELLLTRIERLEEAWELLAPEGSPGGRPPTERGPGVASAAAVGANACADVLAGRTSYVKRLLAGSGPPLRSLGDQAILAVYEHLDRSFAPADLAAALRVSLRTLERGLAQSLACTPRQLILTMKMREARRMLAQGCRVVDVAQQLGFVNVFHFSRRFKSLYRVAPSQIRPSPGDTPALN